MIKVNIISVNFLSPGDYIYDIVINESTENYSFKMKRSLKELRKLDQRLITQLKENNHDLSEENIPNFPLTTPFPTNIEVQNYLMQCFVYYQNNLVLFTYFIQFFDDISLRNDIFSIVMHRNILIRKVQDMSVSNKHIADELKYLRTQNNQLSTAVHSLQESMKQFKNSTTYCTDNNSMIDHIDNPISYNQKFFNDININSNNEQQHQPENLSTKSNEYLIRDHTAQSIQRNRKYTESFDTETILSDDNDSNESVHNHIYDQAITQSTYHSNMISTTQSVLPLTRVEACYQADLLLQQYPSSYDAHAFQYVLYDIFQALKTQTNASNRSSIISLMKFKIRYFLKASAVEVGLHEINCDLPNDPIKFSVFLSKSRVSLWHKLLADQLSQLVDRPALSKADHVRMIDQEGTLVDSDEEYPNNDHLISNVSTSSSNENFEVDCKVDAQDVSVSCNRRFDLCMLAFLEEIAQIVGKDNLFKRSILLIRAWWCYETVAYVGISIKHYLNDLTICIMVSAIFNQYHARITSPLQALCLFLAEYSSYDGTTHAITLQGIVPFKTAGTDKINFIEPTDSHLLSRVILDKYWVLVDLLKSASSSSNNHMNQQNNVIDVLSEDIVLGRFLYRGYSQQLPPYQLGSYKKVSAKFERYEFNVVHPFTYTNMVEKLPTYRIKRIQKVFHDGVCNFILYLSNKNMQDTVQQKIHSFFKVLSNKFYIGQHSLMLNKAINNKQQLPMYSGLLSNNEKLMKNILYCNFILEAIVSESALLKTCSQILKEKRVQPVGEVGKMLADITSTPNLSQKLKEKFGGLKKFLERYNDRFIFTFDHPFNPSVTLRSLLMNLNLGLSDEGVQALIQYNKSKKMVAAKRISPKTSPEVAMLSINQTYINSAMLNSNSDSNYNNTITANNRYLFDNNLIPQNGKRIPTIQSNSNNNNNDVPSQYLQNQFNHKDLYNNKLQSNNQSDLSSKGMVDNYSLRQKYRSSSYGISTNQEKDYINNHQQQQHQYHSQQHLEKQQQQQQQLMMRNMQSESTLDEWTIKSPQFNNSIVSKDYNIQTSLSSLNRSIDTLYTTTNTINSNSNIMVKSNNEFSHVSNNEDVRKDYYQFSSFLDDVDIDTSINIEHSMNNNFIDYTKRNNENNLSKHPNDEDNMSNHSNLF